MEQSQLIELINTLSSEERERVLEFSTLSFFSNSKIKSHVGPLLKLCLAFPWNDASRKMDKHEAFAILFPNQPFVEGKLDKIMVEAQKVIRGFLLTQHYFRKENEFQQVFDFAEIVRTRGLQSRYRFFLQKIRKIQEEQTQHFYLYFHNQFLLEKAVHDEAALFNQLKGDLNIPHTLDALDAHYFLNKSALLNVYLLQSKAASIETSLLMQERIDNLVISDELIKSSPRLEINNAIFFIFKKAQPDANDAKKLLNLLVLHEKRLDVEALSGFYAYLRNICTLILNAQKEDVEIWDLLFAIYKDNLERGILHYEGKLHPSRYLAISEYAIRSKNLEWAFEFIERYKDEVLGENETQDIYRLNLAIYCFAIGDFEKCLDNIPATSPFVEYVFSGKRLELKALYELKSDLLPYKMDAFKMFLSRTSQKLLSAVKRQHHIDFLNILYQLTASIPGDKKRADQLIRRIQEKKYISEWRWLLAKAMELNRK